MSKRTALLRVGMGIKNILSRYFDKIYVISLKRAQGRIAHIKNELKGLNYEIFWGVDGQNLSFESLISEGIYNSQRAKELRHDHENLTINEIGCALSHCRIYEDFLSKSYDRILILEDDATLANQSGVNLEEALMELPSDWDSFYLGYENNRTINHFSIKLRIYLLYPILNILDPDRFNPAKYKRRFTRSYSKNLDISGYHYGTHAYGLSRKGAETLLSHQTPVIQAADHALATLCIEDKMKSYNLKEPIFFQNRRDFKSMIRESGQEV